MPQNKPIVQINIILALTKGHILNLLHALSYRNMGATLLYNLMLPWTNSKENSLKYCIRIVNLLVSETLDWVLVWTSPLSLQRLGVSGTGPAGKSDGPPTDLSVHSRQLSVLWRTGAQVITRGRFIRGEDWLASSYTSNLYYRSVQHWEN